MLAGAQMRNVSPNKQGFTIKTNMRNTIVSFGSQNDKKQNVQTITNIKQISKLNNTPSIMKNRLFNNGSLKIEGDLSPVAQNRNQQSNLSNFSQNTLKIKKDSKSNSTNDLFNKLNSNSFRMDKNNEKSDRSFTPNKNVKKALALTTFKSVPKSNFPTAKNNIFSIQKKDSKMIKKVLNINNSGFSHRSLNSSKLSDNSFMGEQARTNGFSVNKVQKSRNNSSNSMNLKQKNNRSFTMGSKNNLDLNRTYDKPRTANTPTKLNNKSPSFKKILNGSKNPFDTSIMKNFSDFKNKNGNLNVYPGYVSKIQNQKILKNGIKFGSMNNKKVVTGNLLNMNTNDVSTTSSIRSKDNINNIVMQNKESLKVEVNNNVLMQGNNQQQENSNKEKNSFMYQIPVKYGENSKENENMNQNSGIRTNNLKEGKKSEVDFRQITTSPLLRV